MLKADGAREPAGSDAVMDLSLVFGVAAGLVAAVNILGDMGYEEARLLGCLGGDIGCDGAILRGGCCGDIMLKGAALGGDIGREGAILLDDCGGDIGRAAFVPLRFGEGRMPPELGA